MADSSTSHVWCVQHAFNNSSGLQKLRSGKKLFFDYACVLFFLVHVASRTATRGSRQVIFVVLQQLQQQL